jgi:hypothetical protein
MLIADLLEHVSALPPQLAINIQEAVRRYLEGDNLEALFCDGAGPGIRSGRTRLKMITRDSYLRQAYRCIPELKSTAARTQKLLEHIQRLPPALRNYREGHPPVSAVNLNLCRAADYGELPESLRQIQTICRNSGNELPVFIANLAIDNNDELLNLPRI